MKAYPRLKAALLVTVFSGATSLSLLAQDSSPAPMPPGGPRPPMEHGRPPHHPPSPLMEALDTNHDGILSADEIANASASLKKLDKNGDGQLTEDELRPPPRPGGPDGPPPRPGGHDGHDGPPPRGHRGPDDQSAVTPDQQTLGNEGHQAAPAVARAERQPPQLQEVEVIARFEQPVPAAE